MDNQHRKISGYRELSQVEIDLMNEIKLKGEELFVLVCKVTEHLNSQSMERATLLSTDDFRKEMDRLSITQPVLWAEAGKTDLQVGIMKLIRSVAQPTTF